VIKQGKNVPFLSTKSTFGNWKLFVVFVALMIALTVDISIGTTQDMVRDFAVSSWGISLFVTVAAVYIAAQYYILKTVRTRSKETEIKRKGHSLDRLQKIVIISQFVLAAILVITILQIATTSQYYTNLLTAGQTISYGLAIFLMSFLAYRLFSWFKRARTLVVLLYGLFAAMYVANAISTLVVFDTLLLSKPSTVSAESEVIYQGNFEPDNPLFIFSTSQAVTQSGSFVLLWAGTIFLLRHNIQRIGKVKFWALVIPPLLFFMSFYITFYQTINPPTPAQIEDPNTFLTMILLIVYSAVIAVVFFGLGFFSVARSLRHQNNIRDFMLMTAYGLVIFFVSSGATIGQAGYPPFGLVNVLLVGPSSFLIVTGMYRSAVSISEDVKLRQSIRNSAKSESTQLLDSIGKAEMQLEIEKKVISAAKANANELAQQSGIDSSMTDEELVDYLHQATKELKGKIGQSSAA
jgi:hypothetical protein